MHTMQPRGELARIGGFELDVAAAELRRSGRLVALTGQPMRVLIRLVESAGSIVTREELQREIWGHDTHVDFDAGLSTCINQIRTALGDRAAAPRFVETLPRRGYRFIAPVDWSGSVVPPAAIGHKLPLQSTGARFAGVVIGALASEAGDRARVASPFALQALRDKPFEPAMAAGFDYTVLVTLRPLGGPILVHVKLVDRGGWVRWTSDREMTVEELERAPLRLAAELSKPLLRGMVPDHRP